MTDYLTTPAITWAAAAAPAAQGWRGHPHSVDNQITWPSGTNTLPYIQLHTGTGSSTSWSTTTTVNTWSWETWSGQWTVPTAQWELQPATVGMPRFDREPEPELDVRREARAAARDRAEALLLSLCSPDQRQSYQEHGWIEGLTNLGRLYRIHCRQGVNGNVELLRNGEWLTLCAHPPAQLPHADLILGQKLALETDEEHFLSRANIHRVRRAA